MSTNVKKENQATQEVNDNKATQTNVVVTPTGSVSIKQMISHIKSNIGNHEGLNQLLELQPDTYIMSLRHLTVEMRNTATEVVKKKFPDFKVTAVGALSRADKIEQITSQVKKMLEGGEDKTKIVDFIVDKQRKSDIKIILSNIL